MITDLESQIIKAINDSLDKAETIYSMVEDDLKKGLLEEREFSAKAKQIATNIPGFPQIKEFEPKVAKFIAMVVDIRNSTDHLLIALSPKTAKASQLKRVLFEVSALNATGQVIFENSKNGNITEFLGDGFLGLFHVKNEKEPKEVYTANNVAKKILNTGLPLINKSLYERYSLPELKIGIGMAYSQAIITTVGYGNNLHPKAFGECVYRASKISDGVNRILIDERLEKLWPSSKEGKLKFNLFSKKDIEFKAFELSRK